MNHDNHNICVKHSFKCEAQNKCIHYDELEKLFVQIWGRYNFKNLL